MADNPLAAWLLQQDQPPDDGAGDGPVAGPAPSAATAVAAAPPGSSGGQGPSPWELGAEPTTRSPRRLLLLAAVPWVVVILLAAALWWPTAGTPAPPVGEPDAAPAPAAAGPGATDTSEAIAEPSPAASAMTSAAIDDDATLLQVAALTVKAELHGTAEADGDADAQARVRYVDEAVGTAIERLGDVAVVTVTALVLEGDDRGWDRSRTTRHAVALRPGPSGVEPLGAPWALAPPDTPPEPEPVPDESPDRVLAALEAAGYHQISDLQLSRPGGLDGLLVASAHAVAPGENAPADHEVWIRDGPEAAVLGHRR